MAEPQTAETIIKNVEGIAHIGAILLGGLWGYFRFIRGRIFKARLKIEIKGEFIMSGSDNFLKVISDINNIGLTNVNLTPRGSAIRILFGEHLASTHPSSIIWSHDGTFDVFTSKHWLEPGETTVKQTLISLPEFRKGPVLLELIVASRNHEEWFANTVILAQAPSKADEIPSTKT